MLDKSPKKDEFIEANSTCFENFKAQCSDKLAALVKDSTVKFYKTKMVRVNMTAGAYELDSIGLS